MTDIRVGLAGFGYWGPNLLRNFERADGVRVVWVCDRSEERLAAAKKNRPALQTATGADELIRASAVDAVAIATPLSTHFDLALAALQNGKHVLIEKPLCASSEQASILVEEAERRRLVLMVDHTFVYSGAVRKMKEIVDSGALGELYYYSGMRFNLGLYRPDVNVVWDLAPHDFSIVDFLCGHRPVEVSAVGVGHVDPILEDTAYITVFFEGSFLAHVGVSWLTPMKVRMTLLGGDRKMIAYDDLETTEKVKLYDKGVTLDSSANAEAVRNLLVGYRTGDMLAPQIDRTEPLQRVVQEFLDCVSASRSPISDGESGLRVIRLLEAATESIGKRGAPVRVRS